MIYHASINAADPAHVAQVLAEILHAHVIPAPVPPFPRGSQFVIVGDAYGTMIEVTPHGTLLDPAAPGGTRRDPAASSLGGFHLLVGSTLSAAKIETIGRREGWPVHYIETGLFAVVKIWLEGCFPLEVLTPDQMPSYVDALGAYGLEKLDEALRRLETMIAEGQGRDAG